MRHRLLDGYDELVRRLTRRLGSADLAREVIHETYLRFERVGDMEPVRNPDGYIYRTAVNIAKNKGTIERRYLNASDTELLIGIVDEAPDPERSAQARSQAEVLKRALTQLPPRRREIFEASWGDEVPHAELALRYGVHVRTIQRELEQAAKFVRHWRIENDS
jgi:RNA polymerase sigma-70 factor (ECF subfamily)